jgi:hypothetical protein
MSSYVIMGAALLFCALVWSAIYLATGGPFPW